MDFVKHVINILIIFSTLHLVAIELYSYLVT